MWKLNPVLKFYNSKFLKYKLLKTKQNNGMLKLSVNVEIETDYTGQISSFVKNKVWETEANRHFKRGGEITLNYVQWKQGTKENWLFKPPHRYIQ